MSTNAEDAIKLLERYRGDIQTLIDRYDEIRGQHPTMLLPDHSHDAQELALLTFAIKVLEAWSSHWCEL